MISKDVVSSILNDLASWDGPYMDYLSADKTRAILSNLDLFAKEERKRAYGELPYFYAKLSLHADHYGMAFTIPAAYLSSTQEKLKAIDLHTRGQRGEFKGVLGFLKKLFAAVAITTAATGTELGNTGSRQENVRDPQSIAMHVAQDDADDLSLRL
jgi:hypothetical protein